MRIQTKLEKWNPDSLRDVKGSVLRLVAKIEERKKKTKQPRKSKKAHKVADECLLTSQESLQG